MKRNLKRNTMNFLTILKMKLKPPHNWLRKKQKLTRKMKCMLKEKPITKKVNNSQRPLCMIFTILLTLWNSEQINGLFIKLFCFSSDFDETWWSCSYPSVLQFHQVSSKSDEKQKSFINSPFFCSEFQSVNRIVKIIHSAYSIKVQKIS